MLAPNPLLSPLGDFGGLTETILPLPGSPALEAATTSAFTTDQRGFTRPLDGDDDGTASADLGSAEAPNYANPGPDDFLSIWLTDQDLDGSPWGLEQAINTDPAVADVDNPLNLRLPLPNPPFVLTTDEIPLLFGRNRDAIEGTTLKVVRTSTLNPKDFVTVLSTTLDSQLTPVESEDRGLFREGGDSIVFLDANPLPRAFYRLEATYNP